MAVADDYDDYSVEAEMVETEGEEASVAESFGEFTRKAIEEEASVVEEAFVVEEEIFVIKVAEEADDSPTPSSVICRGA